jgi:serine/threonine kinase 16
MIETPVCIHAVKLLGEGGFSYVYLAQDPSSGRLFALKKIRCPLGSDSVNEAIKEVEAYKYVHLPRHWYPPFLS